MKRFLAVMLAVCAFAACKKDDTPNQNADSTNFTSIRQYDVNGVYQGNLDEATDDYTQENWPQWVFDIFKPLDTVNLTGYRETSEINVQALYPNPCRDTQTLKYFAVDPVNIKIAIIDDQKNVHYLKSFHLPMINGKLGLSYKNLSLVPGNYYRMFYGFSAENKPFFLRGHIDMMVN